MAGKIHEYLVGSFDAVTDALAAERQGHYLVVLAAIATARDELSRAETLAVKVQERAEMAANGKG